MPRDDIWFLGWRLLSAVDDVRFIVDKITEVYIPPRAIKPDCFLRFFGMKRAGSWQWRISRFTDIKWTPFLVSLSFPLVLQKYRERPSSRWYIIYFEVPSLPNAWIMYDADDICRSRYHSQRKQQHTPFSMALLSDAASLPYASSILGWRHAEIFEIGPLARSLMRFTACRWWRRAFVRCSLAICTHESLATRRRNTGHGRAAFTAIAAFMPFSRIIASRVEFCARVHRHEISSIYSFCFLYSRHFNAFTYSFFHIFQTDHHAMLIFWFLWRWWLHCFGLLCQRIPRMVTVACLKYYFLLDYFPRTLNGSPCWVDSLHYRKPHLSESSPRQPDFCMHARSSFQC